jgi:hypothetical protein
MYITLVTVALVLLFIVLSLASFINREKLP